MATSVSASRCRTAWKGCDRLAELHPVQGVLPGQGEHRPGRADQPPADGLAGLAHPHQFTVGHHARWQPAEGRVVDRRAAPTTPAAAGVGHRRVPPGSAPMVSSSTSLRTEACEPVSPAAGTPRGWRCPGRRRHVGPSEIGKGGVQFGSRGRQHRRQPSSEHGQSVGVQAGVHRHSLPRSSRRRAMMLR